MNLPINALCIAVAGSLFAYFTDQPLFLIAATPIAVLVGWKELQEGALRQEDHDRIAAEFHPDEDDAMERRLAQFRKALHS